MFAFHLFNTVTNHIAVATNLFKIYITEIKIPTRDPHPPDMIVFIFKSVYCDYNGFPTEQKLHIKSWISRLSKKAQTDRLHKERSRSFFIQLIRVKFPVPSNVLAYSPSPLQKKKRRKKNKKKNNYLQASQVPAGTVDYKSPSQTTVEASAFNNRVTDGRVHRV